MMTYVTAFIFYTLAMIGIMLIGFVVYKKTYENAKGDNKGLIKIIDSTPIDNKKMLLVVKIKNEKFLIASGVEHTTFLSKLEDDNTSEKAEFSKEITKEEVQRSVLDEIYEQNFAPTKKEVRFDDPQKVRAAQIQKQFKELYEKDEEPQIKTNKEANNRKEVMKQLLKKLNSESNIKNGSNF